MSPYTAFHANPCHAWKWQWLVTVKPCPQEYYLVCGGGSRGRTTKTRQNGLTPETLKETYTSIVLLSKVSMPTKFRKNLWIKRGDYVLVRPIEEGDKVRAEIVQILMDKYHVKYIKQVWRKNTVTVGIWNLTIWNRDFLKVGFQMVWFSKGQAVA